MTNLDLSNVTFYQNGLAVTGKVVGNNWVNDAVAHRVARYTITPPTEGVMGLKLYFQASYLAGGSYAKKINLRYYIGTSDSSHANGGPDSEYTGEFTFDTTSLIFTAETDMMLFPGKTYYLWLFPATNDYGWYPWETEPGATVEHVAVVESKSGIGLLYIEDGSGYEPYEIHIDNGSAWERYIVCSDNGTGWNLCG